MPNRFGLILRLHPGNGIDWQDFVIANHGRVATAIPNAMNLTSRTNSSPDDGYGNESAPMDTRPDYSPSATPVASALPSLVSMNGESACIASDVAQALVEDFVSDFDKVTYLNTMAGIKQSHLSIVEKLESSQDPEHVATSGRLLLWAEPDASYFDRASDKLRDEEVR